MIFGKATKNIERDQKSDLGLTLVTGNDDYLPETSHPTPQICIVDFSEEAIKVLDKHRFSYDSVSLHSRVNIPSIQKRYDQELFLPKSNFPDNFHEFDMTFVDLTKNTNVSYDYEDFANWNSKIAFLKIINKKLKSVGLKLSLKAH